MSNSKEYAGFWVRFGAGTIDTVITAPFLIIMLYLFGNAEILSQITHNAGTQVGSIIEASRNASESIKYRNTIDVLFYIIATCYTVFFLTSKRQATPGKIFFSCYVADIRGAKLTPLRACARSLASLLSLFTLGIGFFIIAFSKEKASLHDLICSTRVFKGHPND